jgi:hypothetical protein
VEAAPGELAGQLAQLALQRGPWILLEGGRDARKKKTHAQLDELRQRVASEGMKLREAHVQLEASKAKVEDRSR